MMEQVSRINVADKSNDLSKSVRRTRKNMLQRDLHPAVETNVTFIERGLWLGNREAALDQNLLREFRIGHIITVDTCPLPKHHLQHMNNMFIQITDMSHEDIVSHLDRTFQFIEEALKSSSSLQTDTQHPVDDNGASRPEAEAADRTGSNVLVHCYYGVSRSAAVVIGYLMKKHGISFDEASQRVKDAKDSVGVNQGFAHQLRLYEAMRLRVDRHNLRFRIFRLRVAANHFAKAHILPQSCADVIKTDPAPNTVAPDPSVLRCRNCRRIVASSRNVFPHFTNEKLSWKDERLSSSDLASSSYLSYATAGSSLGSVSDLCHRILFIEPMAWIGSVRQSVRGKILCPRCRAKLGSYDWLMGSGCGCGAKVYPSFYLVPSKLDCVNRIQNTELTI